MRKELAGETSKVSYLFTDHLSSIRASYTNRFVVQQHYGIWGSAENTFNENALPDAHTFTGQRRDNNGSYAFLDYGARRYDPHSGRFISPDPIVPEPGDPQSLNRYAHAGNNPLRLSDPTGYAPQKPGDPDDMIGDCTTQWCWENRYYRAHGYSWTGNGWGAGGGIRFYDEGILGDTIAEAGIAFAGSWDFLTQMTPIATGIVQFGMMLTNGLPVVSGGLAQLQALLGGGATINHGSCLGALACIRLRSQPLSMASFPTLGVSQH